MWSYKCELLSSVCPIVWLHFHTGRRFLYLKYYSTDPERF